MADLWAPLRLRKPDGTTYIVSGAPGPTGPTGPAGGPTGPTGPTGPAGGGAAARYVHTQAVLATTWTVVHNLNAHPAVDVEDAAGTAVYGSIQYVDNNTLTVSFARSATGRANCV